MSFYTETASAHPARVKLSVGRYLSLLQKLAGCYSFQITPLQNCLNGAILGLIEYGKDKNTTRLVVRVQNDLSVTMPPWQSVLCCENQGGFVMQKTESRLTVFFDDPFWVGVYERISDGKLEVCKVTFGAEPKDYEVYEFFLQNWSKLRFGPSVKADRQRVDYLNPKRMQREIKKQLTTQGVGSKAQQAIKLQQAEGKEARKKKSRFEREQEKLRQFEMRQEKRKRKHKGH